jgi:hypothetical protein
METDRKADEVKDAQQVQLPARAMQQDVMILNRGRYTADFVAIEEICGRAEEKVQKQKTPKKQHHIVHPFIKKTTEEMDLAA